jgi:hypothetical protein
LQRFFRLSGSVRIDWPSSTGFHPFQRKEVMPSLSLDGSQTIFAKNRWSFALGGQLDVGGTMGTVRGLSAELGVRKFSVTTEARYHLHARFYAHGKLAPGVAWVSAGVTDGPDQRTDDGALFALESTLGASVLVSEARHPDKRALRVWFSAEGGYVLSTAHTWGLTTVGADSARVEATNLGSMSLSAPMMRIALAGSY